MTFDEILLGAYVGLCALLGARLEINRRSSNRKWAEQIHTLRLALNVAFRRSQRLWIYALTSVAGEFVLLWAKPVSAKEDRYVAAIWNMPAVLLWVVSTILLIWAIWRTGMQIEHAMKPWRAQVNLRRK